VPQDEEIVINDMVLGEVEWSSDDLGGDFVIQRSSGVPMYNFGVVVDDGMMGITHVFRAQEHLMNTPRQVLIYQALGMTPPTFGHMPLILAPDRSKLSKRHGAVSVGDYQKQGYLASGMINYLSQLGWNDGTNKEIYNLDELIESFTMDRMSKVSAIFDKDKFKWVNGHHVRLLSDEEAQDRIGDVLVEQGLVKDKSSDFCKQACILLRDRIGTLAEAADELKSMMGFDLQGMLANPDFRRWLDDGSVQETAKIIAAAYDEGDLDAIGQDPDVFKKLAKKISEARGGVKKKALLAPLRLCLTGTDTGPDMAKFFAMLKLADDGVLIEHPMLSERVQQLKEMKVQIRV
jgi:glutamyl-tRNA synthetase